MTFPWIETNISPGWYPALRCFDTNEGFFPCAAYWDGERWNPENTTHWINKQMPDAEQAVNYAYREDPDW